MSPSIVAVGFLMAALRYPEWAMAVVQMATPVGYPEDMIARQAAAVMHLLPVESLDAARGDDAEASS